MSPHYGRSLAATYLVAWPTWLIGVICVVVTGERRPWAWIIFACGAVPLLLLGEFLGFREREDGWYRARVKWFYRLVPGVELRTAWRTASSQSKANPAGRWRRRPDIH